MIQKVIIHINSYNETAKRYAQKANEYLVSQAVECYQHGAIHSSEEKQFDAVLSFGGDGTILSAAKHYMNYNIPIMGFNVGKLGFLAEFSIKKLNDNINCLLTQNYKIINRFVLEGKIIEANSTDNISKTSNKFLALNDFVLSSEGQTQSRLITLSTYANEQHIGDYWADGVIVATPTGSTAYSLSCGGPIISPDSDVICITPISPHTLTLRPVVLPKNKTISLQLKKQNTTANITADGQKVGTISYNEKFEINIFDKEVKIIVPNDSNYFDVLRNKLLWAEKIV